MAFWPVSNPKPASGAAAAPEVLVEAVVPSKVGEPVPEGDGIVAASCVVVAVPVVRIRQGDIKESMGSMESKSSIVREHVLARAFTGGQSAKHKIEFKRDEVEKTLPPPRP